MCARRCYILFLGFLTACSGTGDADRGARGAAENEARGEQAETLPLGAADDATASQTDGANPAAASGAPEPQQFSSFIEPGAGFSTDEVYDADRERVRFDATRGAMISAASGDSVSGWTTAGNDLRWTGSGVAFRVRFGTEGGERRAYFTETGSGTICNLSIDGPDRLSIRGTNELPPNP